jgi:hypothetical protein
MASPVKKAFSPGAPVYPIINTTKFKGFQGGLEKKGKDFFFIRKKPQRTQRAQSIKSGKL